MLPAGTPGAPREGRLVGNVMHFVRTLRAAGLRVGPHDALNAIEALCAVGVGDREICRAALAATLVRRPQDRPLFDEAFTIFWQDPDILGRMMALLLPRLSTPIDQEMAKARSRRLADALRPKAEGGETQPQPQEQAPKVDLALYWSDRERLARMDFDKMSAEEYARARKLVAQLDLPVLRQPTRRLVPDPSGPRLDLRATLRASLRGGGGLADLRRARVGEREPAVVALCDISGSMERYGRIFLHFMHALANRERRFHGFVFGTRLTSVTRQLRGRDVDVAVDGCGRAVTDWGGGTRIGAALAEFNRVWSRRVLGQGALVLLMTDGLDHAPGEELGRQMERLHKSCRRLVWLNPLLRWDGFEPRAAGVRAMLPHVDDFRPVHNLLSLEQLVEVLAMRHAPPPRLDTLARWKEGTR